VVVLQSPPNALTIKNFIMSTSTVNAEELDELFERVEALRGYL
jgi:hypothetical protein